MLKSIERRVGCPPDKLNRFDPPVWLDPQDKIFTGVGRITQKKVRKKQRSVEDKKLTLDVQASEIEYNKIYGDIMSYNQFLADKVCRLVATDTRPLKDILKSDPSLPHVNTVYMWRLDNSDFRDKFLDARRAQAQIIIDEILELADDPANCEPEVLGWSKERIKTRQWLATKLLPKIYGEKQQTESTVTVRHEDDLKNLS